MTGRQPQPRHGSLYGGVHPLACTTSGVRGGPTHPPVRIAAQWAGPRVGGAPWPSWSDYCGVRVGPAGPACGAPAERLQYRTRTGEGRTACREHCASGDGWVTMSPVYPNGLWDSTDGTPT